MGRFISLLGKQLQLSQKFAIVERTFPRATITPYNLNGVEETL